MKLSQFPFAYFLVRPSGFALHQGAGERPYLCAARKEVVVRSFERKLAQYAFDRDRS
jgi:hypothetical protein